jgi:diadenosine tetraphosphate (Ap4A) HIT family hydrolase
MVPGKAAGFSLDPAIERDSRPLMWLGLCELRVQNDRRWPWLLLVPQRPGIEEIHDLTPLDQAMLSFETTMVAKALKEATRCHKINIAALGNKVPQLHVHIIARNPGIRQSVLGQQLMIKRAHMTKLVRSLEDRGLVTRRVPEDDRRAVELTVSPEAETRLGNSEAWFFDFESRIGEPLSDVEVQQLNALLRKFLGLAQGPQTLPGDHP